MFKAQNQRIDSESVEELNETEACDNDVNAGTENMQANVFPEYTFEAILDDEGDHIKDLELKLKTQGKE